MATEFNTRIAFKRDTSSNWTNKNPVILNGEIILVDTDSGELRAKIGDGSKTYTQLPFSDEVIRNLVTEHNVSETAHENMGWITSDNGLPSDPALINADTLGGIPASEYAKETDIPTQLSQLSSDSSHRTVTDTEKNTWNNKSDFDGDYDKLTNKPTIPTVSTSVSSTSTTTAASSSAVKQAYDLANGAMSKSGGTFTGTVYAGSSYQSYSTYLLRNTRLASSDTTPTVNGQISWTYG